MLRSIAKKVLPAKIKRYIVNSTLYKKNNIEPHSPESVPAAIYAAETTPIQEKDNAVERQRLYQLLKQSPTDRDLLLDFLECDLKINDNSTLWQEVVNQLDDPDTLNKDSLYWDYFNSRSVLSYLAWDIHTASCRELYNSNNIPELDQTGLISGKLSGEDFQTLSNAFTTCPGKTYQGRETHPEYMFNPWIFGDCALEFNQFATYLEPNQALISSLENILKKLETQFNDAMGHHWTITGSKIIILKPLATSIGPHIWHRDSHPASAKKMMIYLSPTSEKRGSTEYELYDGTNYLVNGDGGEWILFENARVLHRAHPPKEVARPVIELTLMPALKTSCKVIDPGINACYPWFPETTSANRANDYFSHQNIIKRALVRSIKLALVNGNVSPASAQIDNMILR